jgi:hypothetical protein
MEAPLQAAPKVTRPGRAHDTASQMRRPRWGVPDEASQIRRSNSPPARGCAGVLPSCPTLRRESCLAQDRTFQARYIQGWMRSRRGGGSEHVSELANTRRDAASRGPEWREVPGWWELKPRSANRGGRGGTEKLHRQGHKGRKGKEKPYREGHEGREGLIRE